MMPRCLTLSLVLLCGWTTLSHAEAAKPGPTMPGVVVTLWPKGAMPGQAATGPERAMPARGDNVLRLTDISEPSFTVYKVAADKPTPAVIICPGGGYGILAYDKEGTEVAAWLNSLGITGIVGPGLVASAWLRVVQPQSRTSERVRQRGIIGGVPHA